MSCHLCQAAGTGASLPVSCRCHTAVDSPDRPGFPRPGRGDRTVRVPRFGASGRSGGVGQGFIVRLVSLWDGGPGGLVLLGRAEVCAVVDGVLGQARAGASGVLLVAGEPGVGKSALLEYAAQSARRRGFRWRGRRGWSRRWSSPSPACSSCARRCWAAWGAARSAAAAIETAFGSAPGCRRIHSSSAWGCWACWRRRRRRGRCCAWSMTCSGWIRRRRGRWGSRRGGCRRTRSRCCWRAASRVSWQARPGWPRCGWRGWPTPTRGRCWPRCCRGGRIRR